MKRVLVLCAGSLLGIMAKGQVLLPDSSLYFEQQIALDEVVISATKVSETTPVAYSDVSKEELQRRNDGQGIPYLISLSPSVIMTSDAGNAVGYSSFRIRGTDANRINITMNGVPINDSESHTVFWANMTDMASSIENIQIQRGAGTSTNGAAAFGATVAMQSEKPSPVTYAEYSVSAGSFGTIKHTVKGGTGLIHDHFAIDARYSNLRSDGFIDRASARMSSYFASAAYYADNTLVKFQAFGNSETTYQAWNGVPGSLLETNRTYNPCGEYTDKEGTKYYDNQTDNYWQHHYHLMASQRIGDAWDMSLTLHYTDGNGYYEEYKPEAKLASYKLPAYTDAEGHTVKKSDLVRRKWLNNDFYGAVYSLNYHNQSGLHLTFGAAANRYEGDHFGRVIWVKQAQNLPKPDYEYYRNTGKKTDYNTFLKGSYAFNNHFNSYLDLQYRGIDYSIAGSDDKAGDNVRINKHWDFFNPKVGLNYNAGGHNAFVSFAVAHREPNRNNFTEAGPNERPTSEGLFDYEAGYTFKGKRFHAGANLYFMDYNNQLILTGKISEIGEALTSNIKHSYRMGIELTGGVQITPWLQWGGNLTLSQNKIKDFTETLENYDANWNPIGNGEKSTYLGTTNIAFSPSLTANSLFDIQWKGFSASLTSQFVGRQYLDNTSAKSRSIDPYFVNNLRMGYVFKPRFIKELAVDLSINNLFNEKYETNGWVYSAWVGGERYTEDGYFTQAGTNVMARLTFRF